MRTMKLFYSPEQDEPTGDLTEVKETPAEDPLIKEEDGELYVKVDTPEEEKADSPDTDPQGLSEEDSEDVGDPEGVSDKEGVADPAGDLPKRLSDTQAKVTELANELKEAKEQLQKANLSPEELREQLKASEVKSLLNEEREKLLKMDPDGVPKDEYYAQQRLVQELQDEYGDKSQKEAIQEMLNNGENREMKVKQKEKLSEDYDLSDEEFTNLSNVAENHYLENGKLTERSYHHALVATYGLDRVMKAESIRAEAKARADIAAAASKQQAGASGTQSGPKSSYQRIDTLMQDETAWRNYLDSLPMEEHAKIDAYLKTKMQ